MARASWSAVGRQDKIPQAKGSENSADAMIKALVRAGIREFMVMMRQPEGRHDKGLEIIGRLMPVKFFWIVEQPVI